MKTKTQLLTKRESEVLALVVKGMSNTEISEKLFISKTTSKAHVLSIMNKFKVKNRVQAAIHAVKEGYIILD